MGKYGGNCENLFEQSHCSAKFYGGFLPVGSKIIDIDHRKRKAILMARRLREKIEMVGMVVEQYYVGLDNDGFLKEAL